MGREGVAQHVRRKHRRGNARPDRIALHQQPERLAGHRPAPAGEEERIARAGAGQHRPRCVEIAPDRLDGLLAQRHEALLAALAEHADHTHVEGHLRELQPDELGDPQARRVERFQHRLVAQRERGLARADAEQRLDLRLAQVLRQPPRQPRRAHPQGRIDRDPAPLHLEAVEAAHGGQPPGDGRSLAPGSEFAGEKILDVGALRLQQGGGALREPGRPAREVAVDSCRAKRSPGRPAARAGRRTRRSAPARDRRRRRVRVLHLTCRNGNLRGRAASA